MGQSTSANEFGLEYYAVTLDLFSGVVLMGNKRWCGNTRSGVILEAVSVAARCCQKTLIYITTPYSYLETVAFDHGNLPQVILMHFCHMFVSFPALNGQDQHSTTKTRFTYSSIIFFFSKSISHLSLLNPYQQHRMCLTTYSKLCLELFAHTQLPHPGLYWIAASKQCMNNHKHKCGTCLTEILHTKWGSKRKRTSRKE